MATRRLGAKKHVVGPAPLHRAGNEGDHLGDRMSRWLLRYGRTKNIIKDSRRLGDVAPDLKIKKVLNRQIVAVIKIDSWSGIG